MSEWEGGRGNESGRSQNGSGDEVIRSKFYKV